MVWILTEEYNQYDQYGEYFLEVFKEKPTKEQLSKYHLNEKEIEHVLKGGGRIKWEDQWYNLNEYEPS